MKKLRAKDRAAVRAGFEEMRKAGIKCVVVGMYSLVTTSCAACAFAQEPVLFYRKFYGGDDRYKVPEHCYVCREREFVIDGVPVKRDHWVKRQDYVLEEGR